MDNNVFLIIGEIKILINKSVASILISLFNDDDLYKTVTVIDRESKEFVVNELGFKNIVKECINHLNDKGLTKEYLMDLYLHIEKKAHFKDKKLDIEYHKQESLCEQTTSTLLNVIENIDNYDFKEIRLLFVVRMLLDSFEEDEVVILDYTNSYHSEEELFNLRNTVIENFKNIGV